MVAVYSELEGRFVQAKSLFPAQGQAHLVVETDLPIEDLPAAFDWGLAGVPPTDFLQSMSYYVDTTLGNRVLGGWSHPLGRFLRPAGSASPVTSSVLRLPGFGEQIVETADDPSLDLGTTGQPFWLALDLVMTDWTSNQDFLSKYTVVFNLQSYLFNALVSGLLRVVLSSTGANNFVFDSTVAPGFVDGTRHAVGVLVEPNVGGTQRRVTFYTAATLAGSWSQLGAAVTQAGAVTLFNTPQSLKIGSHVGLVTVNHLNGLVFGADVRGGSTPGVPASGTQVASPDFTYHLPGATSFGDAQGRPWTVLPSAELVAA